MFYITKQYLNKERGFSLVEITVVIALLAIACLGILSLFNYTFQILAENKVRAGAVALAEEQMELIKNLPYASVGTIGGIPAGVVPQNQTITKNNISYAVRDEIMYIDDPFDGTLGGNPNDPLNTDYKKARVEVKWWQRNIAKTVALIAQIAPKNVETNAGGGTLYITVFNAMGQPVPQANVNIQNVAVTPSISLDIQTNAQGIVVLPGAPASSKGYKITVTKNGCSTDQTYPVSTQNPNPAKPNASVITNTVTTISFAIDLLADLEINVIHQDILSDWKVNTDATTTKQENPAIAIGPDGYSYIAWEDYRGGSSSRIYAQKYSLTGTKQWTTDLQISTAQNQVNSDIATDTAGNIYIAWNDNSQGNQDIYLLKYNSAGTKQWSGSKKIDTGSSSADQITPNILVDSVNSVVYIAWKDLRDDAGDIYLLKIKTSDGSNSWANAIKVNSDSGTAEQSLPSLAQDLSGNIYVIWKDNRNDTGDIYGQKFNSTGTKLWGEDLKINNLNGLETNPEIFGNGTAFFTVWQSNVTGNNDIYFQKLNSAGIKAWETEIIVNSDGGTTEQTSPAIITTSGGNSFIAWTDTRQDNNDIYAQKISSDGVKLWESDIKVNSNITPTNELSPNVALDASGAAHFAWTDGRNGNNDIYATNGYNTLNTANVANVSVSIAGAKIIGTTNDRPAKPIYKTIFSGTSDGSGHISLPATEWDSYTMTPASPHGLLASDPTQPVSVAPGVTQIVELNVLSP